MDGQDDRGEWRFEISDVSDMSGVKNPYRTEAGIRSGKIPTFHLCDRTRQFAGVVRWEVSPPVEPRFGFNEGKQTDD